MEFIDRPSPNFNDRPEGTKPSLIILHFTGGKSAEWALNVLTGARQKNVEIYGLTGEEAKRHLAGPKVSSHYMIDEDGHIFRLVPEGKRAWHAGVGGWDDIEDVNGASIGIELSNRDRKAYTKEQLIALTTLCHDIQRRHKIPAQNIIGHSDIAPGRKDDPGYHFPWAQVAEKNIGVLPKTKLRDRFKAAAAAKKPEVLRKLFSTAGYRTTPYAADKPAPTVEELVHTFQQHHEQHVFTNPGQNEAPGKPTAATVAKLRALARHDKKHRHSP